MTTPTRRAAAVFLTRKAAGELEVFLVERNKSLAFFGGYHALPGGVLDEEEVDAAPRSRDPTAACAIRELFEETGVLPNRWAERVPDEKRRASRTALLAGDRSGWDALARRLPSPALVEIFRLTTPPFAPVRYDTTFYHLGLPRGERPEVIPGELVSGAFWNPDTALRSWRMGEMLIVPPALVLLECLRDKTISGFLRAAREEAEGFRTGRLHPVYFTPGILMAPLETHTKPPATTTNTFLVGVERLWVVDPAPRLEREQERLFEAMDRALGRGARLEGVLLSHEHADHTAALPALCARYNVPFYAHPETLRRLRSPPPGGRAIEEGASFDLGTAPDGSAGWRLVALHTPGHTPGHLVFQETRYRALIAGDVLSTLSSVVIDPDDGGHMATYLRTLSRLLSHPLGTIYPGHGPAARDGRALIQSAIAHRRAREEKVLRALRPAPRGLDEILREAYDDVSPELHLLARASLLGSLVKLREESKAKQVGPNWRRA